MHKIITFLFMGEGPSEEEEGGGWCREDRSSMKKL